MKTVSLYELTRWVGEDFDKFEAHLSQREIIKNFKSYEIESLKSLVDNILKYCEMHYLVDYFFSYSIPQISKEFDLLRICSQYVVNIELKSKINNIEKVINQLKQNVFYLRHLGKEIYSYTYDSNTNKLFQLLDNELVEVKFDNLIEVLNKQTEIFDGDINSLFLPSNFLVSPLNNCEKFLNGEYFLTLNQNEIKEKIDNDINDTGYKYISIQGKAGCGKTLLAYDIAYHYAKEGKNVCIIHCGILCNGHEILANNSAIKLLPVKNYNKIDYSTCDIIIIDEAQRIFNNQFDYIVEKVKKHNIKLIFSYDENQMLNSKEVKGNIPKIIENLENIKQYKLSKKIRTNPEILSFIKKLYNLSEKDNYKNYKNVFLKYAENKYEAMGIINYYKNIGYEFINFTPSRYNNSDFNYFNSHTINSTHSVIGQEFDNVIMYLDKHFFYENKKLCSKNHSNRNYLLYKMLFQGITRTRNKLIIVVVDNERLFKDIMSIFYE